ncbi:MAG TPA: hypothetical protein ENJ46_00495 [Hellea balneolensis]|uniref:Uncharacterized protein n=1 Tax=Hellea balneolensis TaxID=287478 RepID=A0A7C3G4H2_9PROT|nr:hypothetical protein [Hellea balneolensis]
MSQWRLDRTVSLGIILALAIQTGGALMWSGAAEARIHSLEAAFTSDRPVVERLARLEEQMRTAQQSLERIEHRLEQYEE